MNDPAFTTPEEIQARRDAQGAAAQKQAAQMGRDYAECFGAAAGARVLADLINRFAGETYCRGEHIHTAYREGQRAVIEHIARSIGRAHAQQQQESDYER
ncbi:MAG: hypothetical protein O2967_17715 [Proteobacteria bacterium]|nr:hypothetical protein [Pseudomonadota bacterium]